MADSTLYSTNLTYLLMGSWLRTTWFNPTREVLSPSRPHIDRVTRHKLDGQYGLREYGIVDPATRSPANG